MKNEALKSIVVLGSICLVVALLLSSVNLLTAPIIKGAESNKEQGAFLEVLPNATELENVELKDKPASVIELKKDKGGSGYAFKLNLTGTYTGKDMTLIVGIGPDGKIIKMSFVEYTDSKGSADAFNAAFAGGDNTSAGISGATVTSTAIKNALSDAYALLAEHGSVEQSDEQKLSLLYDKLMPQAKNPSSGASKFEAVNAAEFDGLNPAVTAIFAPSTKVGYILLVKNGDSNVAVALNAFGKAYKVMDLEGNELTSGVDEAVSAAESMPPLYLSKKSTFERRIKAAFKSAFSEDVANALTYEAIRLENISSTVETAVKVTSGSKEYYAFFATATGFHGNVQVLYVTDKDGNIVIYKTVSQSESAGYGDKIGSADYAAGISGNLTDLSDESVLVSGATVTSEAVKLAKNDIKAAFNAVKEGF